MVNHKKKYTIEGLRKYFFDEGFTLLDKEYIDCVHKLEYICPKGHKWATSLTNFQRGFRCRFCGYEKISLFFTGRKKSEAHREALKKSHFAKQPDYSPEKHPRYHTAYVPSWNKGLTKDVSLILKIAGEKISKNRKGISLDDRLGFEKAQLMKSKISQSSKGRIVTEETKKKISLAQKGYKKNLSPEQRERLIERVKKQFENGMPIEEIGHKQSHEL